MASKKYLVRSSETLDTTGATRWNQQMLIPVLKQEIDNDIDNLHSSDTDYNMYPSDPLQLPNHVNYYDSKTDVFEQVKKEFPDDEYPQADCNVNNTIISDNNSVVHFIDKEKVKIENTEESLNIKQEYKDQMYEVSIKLETPDDIEIMDNPENRSIHNNSVTHQEPRYKFCGKNSTDLLNHENERIKIELNTSEDNETKELHQCQYCDKCFNSCDDIIAHVGDAHRDDSPKCELCGKQCKSVHGLKRHYLKLHKLQDSPEGGVTRNNFKCTDCKVEFENVSIFNSHMRLCRHHHNPGNETEYKCDKCVKLYKTKQSLLIHMKRTHYDFGRTFECWCGEQFRTPIHLTEHKSFQHSSKGKNEEHKSLKSHCDYGRKFESDCGSELRTPIQLANHKIQENGHQSDNSTYNGKLQCNNCQKTFTNNTYLMKHIRRVHYDYGKVFKCWCGKEFRTPYQLTEHKAVHNYTKDIQCDICQKFFKNKISLVKHKRKLHGDYRRAYECWCGKEFHTPSQLAEHKSQEHYSKIERTNNDKYQCDNCKKKFNTKSSLLRHIMRIHYDYGNEVFKCWCGRVFRTPYHLSSHKSMRHDGKNYGTLSSKVQCGSCHKFYKSNRYLERHRKKMHSDIDSI